MGTYSYKPQKGDRVRITYVREGEVVDADNQRIWFQDDKQPDFPAAVYPISQVYATIEKLEDYNPEPVWVNRDVIRFKISNRKFVRIEAHWKPTDTLKSDGFRSDRISAEWQQGNIEILYKADQQNAA